MTKLSFGMAALPALALVATPAYADHGSENNPEGCDGDKQRPDGCICPDRTRYVNGRDGGVVAANGERYYVAVDEVASHGCMLPTWICRESNDRDGLQRHDGYCTDPECLCMMDEVASTVADEIVF